MPYNHHDIVIIINIVIILDKNSYMHLQSLKIDHQHSVKNKEKNNKKRKNHQKCEYHAHNCHLHSVNTM